MKRILVASILLMLVASCGDETIDYNQLDLSKGSYICETYNGALDSVHFINAIDSTKDVKHIGYKVACSSGIVITYNQADWDNINDPRIQHFYSLYEFKNCLHSSSTVNCEAMLK